MSLVITWPEWLASKDFAFTFGYCSGALATLFVIWVWNKNPFGKREEP
jgi:hypothetical protein